MSTKFDKLKIQKKETVRYLSKIDFSKRAGVSRQAVNNAIKRGQIVVGKSGKLDIANKNNKEYLGRNVNGGRNKPKLTKTTKKKPTPAAVEVENDKHETEDKQPNQDDNGGLEGLEYNDLNKRKIIADIRQKQVKTEKEREMLIPRDTVRKVFSKLYMIDVNQWRTLGPGLAPEIASIAGIDDNETILKISEKIDKESFQILKQVKRLFNDFLKEIKGDLIDENH